jgi:Gpi18-like mannosyltransferase
VLALAAAWAWLLLFTGNGGHGFDLACWRAWSAGIAAHGLGGAYATPGLDYLPGFLWVLAGLNLVTGGPLELDDVWLVKAVALTADLLLAVSIARHLAQRGRHPALALLLFLNPALLYDSWVWGQVDGIHTALVGGAALALVASRPALGAALAVLAANVKPQTVAFLPYLGFLLLHVAGMRSRAWLRVLAAVVTTQVVVLAPFLVRGAVEGIAQVLATRIGHYPVLSMNAFNVWYFAAADPVAASDLRRVAGLTHRAWGIVLFVAASVAIAWPWMLAVRRRWRAGDLDRIDGELFCALGVAGIAFFLFPTQMHERYLHPAVALLGVDAALRGRFAVYGVVSAVYLLNLEAVLRWRGLPDVVLRPRPIAAALLVAFAVALVSLWQRCRRSQEGSQLERRAA